MQSLASFASRAVILLAFPGLAAAFELDLPIRLQDVGYQMFGVAPYGYHVAEHRYDGHPGLDFEYIPGAKIYAAIGGSVQVFTDSHSPDKQTLQLNFSENGKNYRLVHTNLSALEPGVANGATVTRGQILGTAGTQTQAQAGGVPVTYAMTHFQLDDFSANYGLSNPNAVSPVPYFSAAAAADLAAIWSKSAYWQMVCEPYLSNPRGLIPNPSIVRIWSRSAGTLANRIDFTCDYLEGKKVGYTLYDAAGKIAETGIADIAGVTGGSSTIDLISGSGTRKGLIHAKDATLRIAYSAPGGSRPADLAGAAEYSGAQITTPLTGLWWNENESGWGMSLAQHGATVFLAWYTYDPAGNPAWLVMSSCALVGNACSGEIYRVSGGTALGLPWNGAGKVVTRTGAGTVAFADGNTGIFNYVVDGVAGIKHISRQVFAGGSAPPAVDYSDLWWNPAESGWGVALTQQYGTIFATIYTYDAAGKPVWYVASNCVLSGSACNGELYRVSDGTSPAVAWNGTNKLVTAVGSVGFAFTAGAGGTMTYTIDGVTGTKAIARQAF